MIHSTSSDEIDATVAPEVTNIHPDDARVSLKIWMDKGQDYDSWRSKVSVRRTTLVPVARDGKHRPLSRAVPPRAVRVGPENPSPRAGRIECRRSVRSPREPLYWGELYGRAGRKSWR